MRTLLARPALAALVLLLAACGSGAGDDRAASSGPDPTIDPGLVTHWDDPAVVPNRTTVPTTPPPEDVGTPATAAPPAASATPPARRLVAATVEPTVEGRPSAPLRWRPGSDKATARCGAAREADGDTLLVEVVDRAGTGAVFGVRLSAHPFAGPGSYPASGTIQADRPSERLVTGTLTVEASLQAGTFDVTSPQGPRVTGRWSCTYDR
jgi:hypothetical protein